MITAQTLTDNCHVPDGVILHNYLDNISCFPYRSQALNQLPCMGWDVYKLGYSNLNVDSVITNYNFIFLTPVQLPSANPKTETSDFMSFLNSPD